jgi:hypothetical protein
MPCAPTVLVRYRREGLICDVHAHCIPKKFSDFIGDRFGTAIGVPKPTDIARDPVSDSAADAAGVEKRILSPHRRPYLPDAVADRLLYHSAQELFGFAH